MKIFHLNFIVSLVLIVAGFIVPPLGIIDGSVLTAIGLLLMFAIAEKIPEAIKAGKSIRLTKGDFSAEVGNHPPQQD
ncbi:MAG: hypothetical protein IJU35_04515 [Paludibacteraceae bacterium]|jgi:hypothetical protein|nr:hypothetical protein [Paludibacteraceae bacterium]